MLEFERTFLAKCIPPEILTSIPIRMLDVYVPADRQIHPRLRLRKMGASCTITKKVPVESDDASVHEELTIPLNEAEFAALASSSDRTVSKDRYAVLIDKWQAEVDVFQEALEGLVLIDFEFSSSDEMARFLTPPVCLIDVTQELFIAGGMLAGKSYSDIEGGLAKLGYTALHV